MIKVIAGIVTFLLITFLVEPSLVNWFVSLFPSSMDEWKKLLSAIIWVIVFCFGFGFSVLISFLVSMFVGSITDK